MVYCQSPAPAPVCGEVAMLAPVWSEADWGTQVTSSSRHGTSPASADACKHLSCFIPITIFIKHRTNVSNKFVSFICPAEADLRSYRTGPNVVQMYTRQLVSLVYLVQIGVRLRRTYVVQHFPFKITNI